jgi:hypothetical protein
MREVDLVVKEVGGRGKDLRNVSEHVGYALVDASPIQAAVNPLTILMRVGRWSVLAVWPS